MDSRTSFLKLIGCIKPVITGPLHSTALNLSSARRSRRGDLLYVNKNFSVCDIPNLSALWFVINSISNRKTACLIWFQWCPLLTLQQPKTIMMSKTLTSVLMVVGFWGCIMWAWPVHSDITCQTWGSEIFVELQLVQWQLFALLQVFLQVCFIKITISDFTSVCPCVQVHKSVRGSCFIFLSINAGVSQSFANKYWVRAKYNHLESASQPHCGLWAFRGSTSNFMESKIVWYDSGMIKVLPTLM